MLTEPARLPLRNVRGWRRSLFAIVVLAAWTTLEAPPAAGQRVESRAAAAEPLAALARIGPRPRILLADDQTKARLVASLSARDEAAVRFRRWVDAQLSGQKGYAFEPWYAALMSQLTGEASYCRFAVDATETWVASEEALIAAGKRAQVAGDSYLHVGSIVGGLAIVYDWCHGLLAPAQRERWVAYANRAVENVWNHRGARWGEASHPWTGWGTDNPANNYYYSFLRATMLLGIATLGENPSAPTWLETFRKRRIERELVPVFTRDLEGGGSREGTGYGTAMKGLFQLYEWWERSTGERIADLTPHTRASMAHMIHAIVPTLDALAPTGDHSRDSTAALFDYHREYLLVGAALYPDDRVSGVSRSLLERSSVPRMSQGFNYVHDFLYAPRAAKSETGTTLSTTYWAPGTGQLYMRSGWNRDATYLAFSCGPYTESHAHRDQGSFVLFNRGWLAYDQNIASHSGIEQDEEMHNLVRLVQGGTTVKQVWNASCALEALSEGPDHVHARAAVTGSYRGRAGVERVERDIVFLKPDVVVVYDRLVTAPSMQRIWTMNLPGAPTLEPDGFSYSNGKSRMKVLRVVPASGDPRLTEWKRVRRDHSAGVRVDLEDSGRADAEFLHVVSINDSVRSVERVQGAERTGAVISLADGRSVSVGFARNGRESAVEIRAADGSIRHGAPLPRGVTAPPLFAR
jgi:hypothetical protein